LIVVRSVWDYTERMKEWNEFLHKLERLNIQVANPIPILRWNSNKLYLEQLQNHGLKCVPTRWIKPSDHLGSSFDLDIIEQFMQDLGTDSCVIKPAISANARWTFIYNTNGSSHTTITCGVKTRQYTQRVVRKILQESPIMIQPFVKEVTDMGELSFLFFNGSFSHCVLKKPKPKDFRVQEDCGGSASSYQPSESHVNQAKEFVIVMKNLFPELSLLYARVDGVITDNKFMLMELELFEPSLFVEFCPDGCKNFAQAILQHIKPVPST